MKDEIDYIEGLKNNDIRTLKAIYTNFSDMILSWVLKNGGSKSDAKDVLQDALLIILKKASQPNFKLTSKFSTYLFGVAKNAWLRKRQKSLNNRVTFSENERYISNVNIESNIIEQERYSIYQEYFFKLDDFCQQLLLMFYQNHSMDKIAEKFNLKNRHTARNRKYRCQKKLEDTIQKDIRFKEIRHESRRPNSKIPK